MMAVLDNKQHPPSRSVIVSTKSVVHYYRTYPMLEYHFYCPSHVSSAHVLLLQLHWQFSISCLEYRLLILTLSTPDPRGALYV